MNYTDIEKIQNNALEQIKENLKKGIVEWHDRGQAFAPYNPVSDISYTGVNRFLLYNKINAANYEKSYWCTLNQATKAGWKLKQNEDAVTLTKINDLGDDKNYENFVLFDVYNVEQFDNVELNELLYTEDQLVQIGSYFNSEKFFPEQYTDKKDYVRACIHEAISKIVDDADAMEFDMAESFVCNSFGIENTSVKESKIDEWNNKIQSSSDYIKNSLSSAEFTFRKVMKDYEKNKTFSEVADSMEKYCILLGKPSVSSKEIISMLSDDTERKTIFDKLISSYSSNKNRDNVRDLIIIGRMVSSIANAERVKDKDINTIEKEIVYLEKSSYVNFGKDYEKHPYVLANSISNAASKVLNITAEDIFDKLKTKEGCSEIINLLKDNYSKKKDSVTELKLIDGIMKDIIALEYPELIKRKNNLRNEQTKSENGQYKRKRRTR